MSIPSKKSKGIEKHLDSVTSNRVRRKESIKEDKCSLCGKDATEFEDQLSRREYRISGFCQECQDKTFGQTIMKTNPEKCTCCEGTGIIPGKMIVHSYVKGKDSLKTYDYMICSCCRGVGKVDWATKVTKSRSEGDPDISMVTEEVRDLIDNDSIFGAEEIVAESMRKEVLEKAERNKRN